MPKDMQSEKYMEINYYQRKLDGVKTYGKVFEDDGNTLRI